MIYFFIIFALVVQGVIFLAHWFLYKTVVNFFYLTNPLALLALKFSFVLSFLFLLASFIASRYNNIFTRVLYFVGSSWLGTFFYLLLVSILIWFLYALFIWQGSKFNISLVAGILFAFAILVSVYGIYNNFKVVITKVSVKLENLPAEWQGRKMVWISDVHLDQVHGPEFMQRVVDKINLLNPDLVVIGGDLYDGTAVDEVKVIEPLRNLKAPKGLYFITGNHEEFSGKDKYAPYIKNVGIKILDNEKINLDGVELIGVDYFNTTRQADLEKILLNLNLDKKQPNILFKHSPSFVPLVEKMGVDLMISGHTHRAQMFPLNYVTYLIYHGFDYGLKNYNNLSVYTSSGVGSWGPPLRVGTKSEIVEFVFDNK